MNTKTISSHKLISLVLSVFILTLLVLGPCSTVVTATTILNSNEYTHHMFISEVPLYSQRDYNDPYGKYGTIYNSGCGIVCLSMVATYLKDDWSLTPDILAKQFGDYNTPRGSKWVLFDESDEVLGLGEVQCVYEWTDEVENALKNGQLVISRQGRGLFTRSGHFILLTGFNDSGKIIVHDPNGDNWNKYNLKPKFEDGFEVAEICEVGGPYWIYPKKEIKSVPKYNQLKYSCFSINDKDIFRQENNSNSFKTTETLWDNDEKIFTEAHLYSHATQITCLSMVATYLKDNPCLSPDFFVEELMANPTNYTSEWPIFFDAAENFELGNVEANPFWATTKVYTALENGQVVISSQFDGPFGGLNHYIVLAGITEDGKIIVYDPDGSNWSKPELIDKFKKGFDFANISEHSVMYWIFEKKS